MRNPSTSERLILAAPRRPKWIFGARSRNAASERGKAVKIRRGRAAVTGSVLRSGVLPEESAGPNQRIAGPLDGQPLAANRGREGAKRLLPAGGNPEVGRPA